MFNNYKIIYRSNYLSRKNRTMSESLYENSLLGSSEDTYNDVKNYYGDQLKSSADLATNACTTFSNCNIGSLTSEMKKLLSNINFTVSNKYYGCGLLCPNLLNGLKILDLGCGSGRDCFMLSQLVGETGEVVGVDMTEEQLNVAISNVDWHRDKFGYKNSNTVFLLGNIEKLDEIKELKDKNNYFDVVISNCVVNLSPDKKSVLNSLYRLLKDGGEFYFSDVYSNKRVPNHLKKDKVLWGECLSGALYWNDFIRLSKECGFIDPRLVEDSRITVNNKEIEKQIGNLQFYSATYRLFKIPRFDFDCEDYGQAVIYLGTIPLLPNQFILDNHHIFETGKVEKVCGNSYRMLNETRFKSHFHFIGDFSRHFGIFEGCGKNIPFTSIITDKKEKSSCC